MKVNVFLNGEYFLGNINPADKNIACDGAYKYCSEKGIKIDAVVGDFDSLGYEPNGAIKYEREKDFTDGEGAVEYVKSFASEINFYNFGGKREDHFFGNIALLIKCNKLGIKGKGITNYSEIIYSEDYVSLKNVKGKTISIVPFSKNAHIINGVGLKYSIKDVIFSQEETLGISNEAIEDVVEFKIIQGGVLVFVNY